MTKLIGVVLLALAFGMGVAHSDDISDARADIAAVKKLNWAGLPIKWSLLSIKTTSQESTSTECTYGRNTIAGGCNQPPRSSYSYSYQWYQSPSRPSCNPLSPRCNY
jgi:hypothetical protein